VDENRAQAYAVLINALLTCPSGEAMEILQANSQFLDAEFLQVCEVIADNLAAEGQENAADFLRDLASQLGQLLGMNDEADTDNYEGENPQKSSKFILDLLQVEESNGDIAVIYPMLAERQHLLKFFEPIIIPLKYSLNFLVRVGGLPLCSCGFNRQIISMLIPVTF
jgi:hypothetical protein